MAGTDSISRCEDAGLPQLPAPRRRGLASALIIITQSKSSYAAAGRAALSRDDSEAPQGSAEAAASPKQQQQQQQPDRSQNKDIAAINYVRRWHLTAAAAGGEEASPKERQQRRRQEQQQQRQEMSRRREAMRSDAGLQDVVSQWWQWLTRRQVVEAGAPQQPPDAADDAAAVEAMAETSQADAGTLPAAGPGSERQQKGFAGTQAAEATGVSTDLSTSGEAADADAASADVGAAAVSTAISENGTGAERATGGGDRAAGGGRSEMLDEHGYCALVMSVAMVLLPKYGIQPDPKYDPHEDWLHDNEGMQQMDLRHFFDCMFDLADSWATGDESASYMELLQSTLLDIQALEDRDGTFSQLLLQSRTRTSRQPAERQPHTRASPPAVTPLDDPASLSPRPLPPIPDPESPTAPSAAPSSASPPLPDPRLPPPPAATALQAAAATNAPAAEATASPPHAAAATGGAGGGAGPSPGRVGAAGVSHGPGGQANGPGVHSALPRPSISPPPRRTSSRLASLASESTAGCGPGSAPVTGSGAAGGGGGVLPRREPFKLPHFAPVDVSGIRSALSEYLRGTGGPPLRRGTQDTRSSEGRCSPSGSASASASTSTTTSGMDDLRRADRRRGGKRERGVVPITPAELPLAPAHPVGGLLGPRDNIDGGVRMYEEYMHDLATRYLARQEKVLVSTSASAAAAAGQLLAAAAAAVSALAPPRSTAVAAPPPQVEAEAEAAAAAATAPEAATPSADQLTADARAGECSGAERPELAAAVAAEGKEQQLATQDAGKQAEEGAALEAEQQDEGAAECRPDSSDPSAEEPQVSNPNPDSEPSPSPATPQAADTETAATSYTPTAASMAAAGGADPHPPRGSDAGVAPSALGGNGATPSGGTPAALTPRSAAVSSSVYGSVPTTPVVLPAAVAPPPPGMVAPPPLPPLAAPTIDLQLLDYMQPVCVVGHAVHPEHGGVSVTGSVNPTALTPPGSRAGKLPQPPHRRQPGSCGSMVTAAAALSLPNPPSHGPQLPAAAAASWTSLLTPAASHGLATTPPLLPLHHTASHPHPHQHHPPTAAAADAVAAAPASQLQQQQQPTGTVAAVQAQAHVVAEFAAAAYRLADPNVHGLLLPARPPPPNAFPYSPTSSPNSGPVVSHGHGRALTGGPPTPPGISSGGRRSRPPTASFLSSVGASVERFTPYMSPAAATALSYMYPHLTAAEQLKDKDGDGRAGSGGGVGGTGSSSSSRPIAAWPALHAPASSPGGGGTGSGGDGSPPGSPPPGYRPSGPDNAEAAAAALVGSAVTRRLATSSARTAASGGRVSPAPWPPVLHVDHGPHSDADATPSPNDAAPQATGSPKPLPAMAWTGPAGSTVSGGGSSRWPSAPSAPGGLSPSLRSSNTLQRSIGAGGGGGSSGGGSFSRRISSGHGGSVRRRFSGSSVAAPGPQGPVTAAPGAGVLLPHAAMSSKLRNFYTSSPMSLLTTEGNVFIPPVYGSGAAAAANADGASASTHAGGSGSGTAAAAAHDDFHTTITTAAATSSNSFTAAPSFNSAPLPLATLPPVPNTPHGPDVHPPTTTAHTSSHYQLSMSADLAGSTGTTRRGHQDQYSLAAGGGGGGAGATGSGGGGGGGGGAVRSPLRIRSSEPVGFADAVTAARMNVAIMADELLQRQAEQRAQAKMMRERLLHLRPSTASTLGSHSQQQQQQQSSFGAFMAAREATTVATATAVSGPGPSPVQASGLGSGVGPGLGTGPALGHAGKFVVEPLVGGERGGLRHAGYGGLVPSIAGS